MILLYCSDCKDVFKITENARQCRCGASLGAVTGKNDIGPIISHSGNSKLFEANDENFERTLPYTRATIFTGYLINSKNIIKLGK